MNPKIKSYGDEVIDFYDKEIPKVDSNYTCLAVISLDSALKKIKTIIREYFYKSVNIIIYFSDFSVNLSDFSSSYYYCYSDDSDEE